MPSTQDQSYTQSLIRKQTAWWKRLFDVQAPYRWNLLRLRPGYTLEIGCGIGRNLLHLGGHAIGVDHNVDSVAYARSRGLDALTQEEFNLRSIENPMLFDSLLLSHVLEHMTRIAAVELIRTYLAHLKTAGRLIMITPQESGHTSDRSHVEFMDFTALRAIQADLGFQVTTQYSFPFPRPVGLVFRYNEFISVGRRALEGLIPPSAP